MFSIYLIFILFLLAIYLVFLLVPGKKGVNPKISLEEVSVIVPFRNETSNLPYLLQSIEKQGAFPGEILFVNDHSEDDFRSLFTGVHFEYHLLDLEMGEGKKAALKCGVSQAKGRFILTLDADVELPPGYFSQLERIAQTDLTVLPVKMKSNTLPGLFATLDFYFLNALNIAISHIGRPIVANGANLLFRKESFEKMLENPVTQHVSSGDDMFLLQSVLKQKKEIYVVHDQELVVTTAAPSSLKKFLHQRLRWIGKTKHIKDPLANFIGFLGLLYHVSGFVIVAFYPPCFWILFVKAICDTVVLLPHLIRMKQPFLLFLSPVFTLLYPLYLLVIAFGFVLLTPQWKNRKVEQ